jgi:Lon protease-like protein
MPRLIEAGGGKRLIEAGGGKREPGRRLIEAGGGRRITAEEAEIEYRTAREEVVPDQDPSTTPSLEAGAEVDPALVDSALAVGEVDQPEAPEAVAAPQAPATEEAEAGDGAEAGDDAGKEEE